MLEKLQKIRIDIISLILSTLSILFLGIYGLGLSIIFLIIYIITTKKNYFFQKFLLILNFIGIILAFGGFYLLNNMENKGLDYIGEALFYGGIVSLGMIILIICPLIILIIDNKKFIFRKKTLKVIAIIGVAIMLYFPLHTLITTTKISENIPTVENFKEELTNRGFLTDTTNYKLYGIKKSNNKAINLYFIGCVKHND